MVTRTDDGLDIQPLYTADEAPTIALAPGQAPFIRSTHETAVPWEIRQRVWPAIEDSRAVGELESGATGVLVDMAEDVALTQALDGVLLDLAPVSLSGATVDQAGELLDVWDSAGTGTPERRGCSASTSGRHGRAAGERDLDRSVGCARGAGVRAVTSGPTGAGGTRRRNRVA